MFECIPASIDARDRGGHSVAIFRNHRFWTARGRDRTQSPKPFSTVAMAIGEPVHVRDTEPATLAAAQHEVEAALKRLEARALEMLATDDGQPGADGSAVFKTGGGNRVDT